MSIDILGSDLAKNVFQLHGVNRNGAVVFKRRVMRDQLLSVAAITSYDFPNLMSGPFREWLGRRRQQSNWEHKPHELMLHPND